MDFYNHHLQVDCQIKPLFNTSYPKDKQKKLTDFSIKAITGSIL